MNGVLSEYGFSELTRLLFLLAVLCGASGLIAGVGIGLAIANTGFLDQYLPQLSFIELLFVLAVNLFSLLMLLVAELSDAITILRRLIVEHYLDRG